MPKSINAISDKFRSIFGFYYDGFRNMTWGRPLCAHNSEDGISVPYIEAVLFQTGAFRKDGEREKHVCRK